MRLVQVVVPEDQREAVLAVVRERNFGYVTTDETGTEQNRTLVSFLAPADAVEHTLDDLEAEGLDWDRYTASLETEFSSFDGIDDVQDEWAKTPNRIAPRTLRSKAKDLRLNDRSYLWMMVLSTIVATSGLLASSPAVVVGSMVLAPIVSPMLTASVGAVRDDREMVLDSLRMQGVGLAVAVVGAVLFSLLVKHFFAVPMALDVAQMELISIRFSPGLLSVAVGLAAGAAGAFSLATKGQVSIVGVMISAALIPTAAASGIGFAWARPVVGIGSLVLLLITIIAVNIGGYLMLKYLGYAPDEVDESFFSLDGTRETVVVVGTVVLVVAVAVATGYGSYQQFKFERTVNTATTDVLDSGRYEGLEVTTISSQYVGAGPFSNPSTVTVTVSRITDRNFPGLPNAIDRAIAERTGQNVTVRVQYENFDTSNVTGSLTGPADTVPGASQGRAGA